MDDQSTPTPESLPRQTIAQPGDNATVAERQAFIKDALASIDTNSYDILWSRQFPIAEQYGQLEIDDRKLIRAATMGKLTGCHAYVPLHFGISYGQVAFFKKAYRLRKEIPAAWEWYDQPGRNFGQGWQPKRHAMVERIVEIVTAHGNALEGNQAWFDEQAQPKPARAKPASVQAPVAGDAGSDGPVDPVDAPGTPSEPVDDGTAKRLAEAQARLAEVDAALAEHGHATVADAIDHAVANQIRIDDLERDLETERAKVAELEAAIVLSDDGGIAPHDDKERKILAEKHAWTKRAVKAGKTVRDLLDKERTKFAELEAAHTELRNAVENMRKQGQEFSAEREAETEARPILIERHAKVMKPLHEAVANAKGVKAKNAAEKIVKAQQDEWMLAFKSCADIIRGELLGVMSYPGNVKYPDLSTLNRAIASKVNELRERCGGENSQEYSDGHRALTEAYDKLKSKLKR